MTYLATFTKQEAIDFLGSCEWRFYMHGVGEAAMPFHREVILSVNYLGQWFPVCRCDNKGEVYSGRLPAGDDAESLMFYREPLAYYRNRVFLGARITNGYFCVIDSYTDG